MRGRRRRPGQRSYTPTDGHQTRPAQRRKPEAGSRKPGEAGSGVFLAVLRRALPGAGGRSVAEGFREERAGQQVVRERGRRVISEWPAAPGKSIEGRKEGDEKPLGRERGRGVA